jgi:hypothetical protein
MNKTEYDKKRAEIETRYEEELQRLEQSYALSNKKYEIGDVVKSVNGCFRIDEIKWRRETSFGDFSPRLPPECIYEGIAVRLNGKPYRKLCRKAAAQSDIILVISKAKQE